MPNPELHEAASTGDAARIREILRALPADIDERDGTGRTSLHLAAEAGHLETVALLLAHGANPNTHERNCETTPLHDAVFFNHRAVVEVLLAHGADPNARDENASTPLHCAASCGSRSVVKTSASGRLAMASEHSAAGQSTSAQIIKSLLAAGADPKIQRSDGRTPAQSAAQWGHREAAELLGG